MVINRLRVLFSVSMGDSPAIVGIPDYSGAVSIASESVMSCNRMSCVLPIVIHMLHKIMKAWGLSGSVGPKVRTVWS